METPTLQRELQTICERNSDWNHELRGKQLQRQMNEVFQEFDSQVFNTISLGTFKNLIKAYTSEAIYAEINLRMTQGKYAEIKGYLSNLLKSLETHA